MMNKLLLQNLAWTSTSKFWPTLCCAQSLNKSLALGTNVSSQIWNKLLPTWSSASTIQHEQQLQPQQVLSRHLHTPGPHQSSLLNSSQWVSQLGSHWQAYPMIGLGSDKNAGTGPVIQSGYLVRWTFLGVGTKWGRNLSDFCGYWFLQ